MSPWVEFFDIFTEPSEAPTVRPGDPKVHPVKGRSIHPLGFELQDKQIAINFANKNSSTHLRFYRRDGKYEYLKRGNGDSWRKSNAEEFHEELGLVEP